MHEVEDYRSGFKSRGSGLEFGFPVSEMWVLALCFGGCVSFSWFGSQILVSRGWNVIVNASARPPRLAGLPTVGTCNYRYAGI